MLTLVGGQVECLWDEVLSVAARELPEDLVVVPGDVPNAGSGWLVAER
jgi:hypothetical protein